MKEKKEFEIEEQSKVLENKKKNMIVSASAGSGKTFVMIKYITKLVCEKNVPIKDFVILTFTKAAAAEMKERLEKSLRSQPNSPYIVEQLDNLATANITTIDAFYERNLKKYANLVGLNENFSILDGNLTKKLKYDAFDLALKNFYDQNSDGYFMLIDVFKNNNEKVRDILLKLEELLDSVSDREKFLETNLNNAQGLFDCALNFLYEDFKTQIQEDVERVSVLKLDEYEAKVKSSLNPLLFCKNLFEMAKCVQEVILPRKPLKKQIGDDASEILDNILGNIKDVIKSILQLGLLDENNVEYQRNGLLEKTLLELYLEYDKVSQGMKAARNALTFADLSKYMTSLSEKTNLFENIKYVFVDEYQDTNKIQARIIKNIAKNSNFVAVGDVKQGIYGFRLASCETFLEDVESFENDENSTVNYLKENFRSNQKVLDFVNSIFQVCMTENSTGVDYKGNAMLHAFNDFVEDEHKAVTIHLIKPDEEKIEALPKVYSVKEATTKVELSDLKQILDIKNQIFQVRGSKIYDGGVLRDCQYGDIAILSRNRTELFNNLAMYLQESGIPVYANSKKKLLDEVEINVVLNFLKIALNLDDDIALLSVLLSPFGGFELAEIIEVMDGRTLHEIVKENEKFKPVIEKIQHFEKQMMLYGAKVALKKMFDESGYFAYLNIKPNHAELNTFVKIFLQQIDESGFAFDLPGLINYFENVEIDVSGVGGNDDCVIMDTIHGSKGLEYPVVFLIGCDKPVVDGERKENHDVKVDERFGFSLKYFDTESNENAISVRMKASMISAYHKNFVEELMIFYVALTRAKNRLYLFGNYNENIFKRYNLFSCKSYFDWIFYALGDMKKALKENDTFVTDDLLACVIDDVVEKRIEVCKAERNVEYNPELAKKIEDYLNFEYKYDDKLNFKLKESVTELNNKNDEEKIAKYSNENFQFGGAGVEIGNAYHLALKILDFDKIDSVDDIQAQLEKSTEISEDDLRLLNMDLLLKNILILKQLTDEGICYKEREFIMKEKLCNLLENVSFKDEIMVQGIVDLFVVKEKKVCLIDYKYSNSTSENYLVNKYKNQLKFYKMAIENALNLHIDDIYLLSLKQAKLIKVSL